jgi:methyltransferase (TIGR00027 family)
LSTRFASTARWIAAARARESRRPDRLFDDPFAEAFAGEEGCAMLARSEAASGGENAFLPVRTRWFDDALMAAVRGQVVLLGAGFDTRAFRLPLPEETRVFEIDGAELLAEKERTFAAVDATPRCIRTAVAADLSEDWTTALSGAGFDPSLPTVWMAEGLFFYLSADAVTALVRQTAAHSAAGSVFLADTFGTGLLTQPSMQSYLRWLKQAELPPPFCTDDPAALFKGLGWDTASIISPGEADANYGRFPRPSAANRLPEGPTNRAFLVRAVREEST